MVDRRNAEPVIYLTDDEQNDASIAAQGGCIGSERPQLLLPKLTLTPPTILQRYHIEIWVEKTTVNDILLPLAEARGVNIVTGAGEISHTRCVELVRRAQQSQRSVRILYVSDFDPGGRSIPVAAARKIEFVMRGEGLDLDVQLRPVVLTPEQCIRYQLPRSPIKESERRAAVFEQRFGAGATELDALEALPPGELARILNREIDRYYDAVLDDNIAAIAVKVKRDLGRATRRVLRRHAKDVAKLKAEDKKLQRAISASEKRARPLFKRIQRDLDNLDIDAGGYDWPAPKDGDEESDPLFDSTRGYVEQIDRYKEHQDKPTEFERIDKRCEVCGGAFQAQRSTARVCSAECRSRLRYLPGGERAS
jgi:predicted nucleic acid-binding Zn ribbon protein